MSEQAHLTVGELKALLERTGLPDDATVWVERDANDTDHPFYDDTCPSASAEVNTSGNGRLIFHAHH